MEVSNTIFTLSNEQAELAIDSYGGAMRSFRMRNRDINPISFSLPSQHTGQRGGFQGHFICLGRWGDPTAGEQEEGLLKHGDSCRLPWDFELASSGREATMVVSSLQEGLAVQRSVGLSAGSPLVRIDETITNIGRQGRFYQLVQHPTFAAPFLDKDVILFCNAGLGFNQAFGANPDTNALHWPYAYTEEQSIIRLNRFDEPYNGVVSYVVGPEAEQGWAVLYSKKHRLLMGYVWPREHYPWINIWQQWDKRKPVYLGVEFGTTGLHRPFCQVVKENNTRVFDERTYAFLDAGRQFQYSYHLFLHRVAGRLDSIESVSLDGRTLLLSINGQNHSLNAKMG